MLSTHLSIIPSRSNSWSALHLKSSGRWERRHKQPPRADVSMSSSPRELQSTSPPSLPLSIQPKTLFLCPSLRSELKPELLAGIDVQNFHFCCGSEYPVPCWLSESDGTNWGSSRSETTPGASLRSPASIPGVSGSRHFPSGALYVRLKTNRFLFLSPNESFLLIHAQTCSRHIFYN